MAQYISDNVRATDQRQKLIDDHPLVVPTKQLLGRQEDRILYVVRCRVGLRRRAKNVGERACDQTIDNGVMVFEKSELELPHQHVLVISRIADQRGALGGASEVVGTHQKLCSGRGVVVEMRACRRSRTLDVVGIECRRPEIAKGGWVGLSFKARRRVEIQVVVDKLGKKGEACSKRRAFAGAILQARIHTSLGSAHLLG